MRLAFFVTIFMVINIRDFEFDENVDNGISRIDEMYWKYMRKSLKIEYIEGLVCVSRCYREPKT